MAGAPSRDCTDWLEKPRAQPNHRTMHQQDRNESSMIPQGDPILQRDAIRSLQRHTLFYSPRPPFCREVPRPFSAPRPAPFSAPPSSRRLQKGKEEGASPPLGRVTSRTRQSGEDAPPPPSFHSGGEGSEIRAGNVRAGVLGGRCLRGRFGREILAGDALHALDAAATPLLPSVPRRS